MKSLLPVVTVLYLVGCSDPGATTPASAALEDRLAPPARGEQVIFGPFDVRSGGEVQLCRTLKLSNTEAIGVNRLEVQLNQGSHHFIVFRSKHSFPDQTFPCWGTVNFEDWEFVLDVNKTGGNDWTLSEGQGFVFEPHQQIMVQSHYVNASTVQAPEGGLAVLNIHEVPREQVRHELHGMFTVNTRLALPPRSDYQSSRLCTLSSTVELVAMTGHFHARGTEFNVDSVIPADGMVPEILTEPVYTTDNWDAPLFKVFEKPMLMNAGNALRFRCSYYNETDKEIGFGGHADVQEHCNLFFHYYQFNPQDSPLTCAQGSGGW